MRRREFLGVLGGAGGATWHAIAQAQQAERVRRIGLLFATGSDDDDFATDTEARIAAFVQGLSAFGWIEGRNCRLDTHLPKATADEIRAHITELIAAAPDVVLTSGGTTFAPLLQATRTIPIVFMSVVDPVGSGFIDSLGHPGGNATGLMQFDYSLSGKWLEMLKQVAPGTTRAAIIRDATTVSGIGQFAVIQSVAPSLGIDVVPINVRDAGEIENAIGSFARLPNGGLIVETGAAVRAQGNLVVTLAAKYRLPAIFPRRSFVDRGGLMSYGYDALASSRLAAGYVDRILRGAKPADLPVQAPTKYEMVVNMKTAKALGLEIPPTFLARADVVIE